MSVIINLDWLSSTETLLPLILLSSLSLAEFYHPGKRTSFMVETLKKFHTMLSGCDEFIIAPLHSILFLPTWVKRWYLSLEVPFHHYIQGSSNTHSQLP